MAKRVIYNPPSSTFKELRNFRLKNLEKVFDVAHYERRMSTHHVNRIVHAMLYSNFYDNTIRVVKFTKNKRFTIIDGQHRIEALRVLRDQYGLTTYDLTLQIFDQEDQREVYRRLNLGKKLQLLDHLKAVDNGSIRFFNRLRQYYSHDRTKNRPRFEQILNAVYYQKTGSMRAVIIPDIEKVLKAISEEDIKRIREFTLAIKNLDIKSNSKFFKTNFYRNLFRVFIEKKIDRKKLEQFAIIASNDKYVLERNASRNNDAVKELYEYLIDKVYPKLSGRIKKVEKNIGEGLSSPIIQRS